MTNIVRPENDAPVDHMKLHKDIVWVIRTLWGGAVAIAVIVAWAVALASDVQQNSEDLENTVSTDTAAAIVQSLERIERKIDEGDARQREIQQDLAALNQKVEDLEEEIEEDD